MKDLPAWILSRVFLFSFVFSRQIKSTCLFTSIFPFWGHREGAHMGEGRVRPWLRHFIVGPYVGICGFDALLKGTSDLKVFWHLPHFHFLSALWPEPRTPRFSAHFPNRLSFHRLVYICVTIKTTRYESNCCATHIPCPTASH